MGNLWPPNAEPRPKRQTANWLKYGSVVGPLLAVLTMISTWVYHVETGLSRANDVNMLHEELKALHEKITGQNRDLSYQRARIANLESLFEPYLIEKKVQEELRKRGIIVVPPEQPALPVKAAKVPTTVTKKAEDWARSQIHVDPPKPPSDE